MLIDKIKEEFIYIVFKIKDDYIKKKVNNPKVKTIEETIEKILKDNVSVSRYGDGEFRWMFGLPQNSFQENSKEMQERLLEIIKSNLDNHIVCLSDSFEDLNVYNDRAKRWWTVFMGKFRTKWISCLDINKEYYNTNISRLYIDFKDKNLCKKRFELVKRIWDKKDILIVEGEKSRLGIGNDLFYNAKSIKRILAPAINAYDKYDDIIDKIKKNGKNKLILIALGPTATILAYDLCKEGFQAIDIGHIDIEYEWFLKNANDKIPIKNKFTNEAGMLGGREVGQFNNNEYLNQIIERIN